MLGPSWKTTLLGSAAILTAGGHLLTAIANGDFNAVVMDGGVILAGMQGLFAKDHNVTGGDTANK